MQVHGVFVGIDYYQDPTIPNLRCSANDARTVSEMFQNIGTQVEVLLNSRATALGIRRALTALGRSVESKDTAVFYFSGHGAKGRVPYDVGKSPHIIPFLVPYDSVLNDLLATAIRMEDIGRFLEAIPCQNVLFFFDSCYSGAASNSRSFPIPGARELEKGASVFPKFAGEGKIVLAASGEYEPAYEDPSEGHGIFTEYLIDALSGKAERTRGHIALSAVFDYLSSNVPEKTDRLYKVRQRPLKKGKEREPIKFPIMRESTTRTLINFPHQFLPLTVVVGDRRETEPKTPGDLFASSASPADLRWLLQLGLPEDTEIVSDKVFRVGDEKYLKETYGVTNMLVVGSPAVNFVARVVNEKAFFPFAVGLGVGEQWNKISDEIKKLGDDRTKLTNYAFDPRNRELLRFYMNQYRKGGFIDPVYSFVRRGDTIPFDRDYGVVTLCRNPYEADLSGRVVCILAAGIHLPGTMHALALLGQTDTKFKDRPLGGVFNVELTEIDWVKRMARAQVNWSTEPYTLMDMRKGLTSLKDPKKVQYIPGIDKEAIDDLLKLLDQLSGRV
jgi:hypothetical protein